MFFGRTGGNAWFCWFVGWLYQPAFLEQKAVFNELMRRGLISEV
jgi:hypothetical protein